MGAFGVDVVGKVLVEVEQVASHEGDGGLFEEVLLVQDPAREVVGERQFAHLDPIVVHDAGGGDDLTPTAIVGHVAVQVVHHVFILMGLTCLGVDAITGKDHAVVAHKIAVGVVVGQPVAFAFIERLGTLAGLHGHHVGGAVDLTAELGVDQGIERPVLVGGAHVDAAGDPGCAVAYRHAVFGDQIRRSRFVEQWHGVAVGVIERTDGGTIGRGVLIDIVPSVDGAVFFAFFDGDGGTVGAPDLGEGVHVGARQIDDLVPVAGEVQAHLHTVVLALCDVVGHDGLDTLVGHHARVDGHVAGARRGGEG